MTHAALQDLLPCPFCGEAGHSFESRMAAWSTPTYLAGCDPCNLAFVGDTPTEAIAAWNRRAALSAMEGEAVDPIDLASWLYRKLVSFSEKDYDSPRVVMDLRMACESLAKLYTAPPPQQAVVPALEVFRIAGGDVECCPNPTADEALRCLRDLRECYDESLATHPTPSPGPQGGGDGGKVRKAMRAACDAMAALATPPQPEAQVSDAMVERAAFALSGVNKNQWEYDALLRKRHIAAARTALTAALTTSGRDGDG